MGQGCGLFSVRLRRLSGVSSAASRDARAAESGPRNRRAIKQGESPCETG